MEHSLEGAGQVRGTMPVPATVASANRALVLAALAAGQSVVDGCPAGSAAVATALQQVGVRVEVAGRQTTVHGAGLRGLRPSPVPLDLRACGDAALLLVAMLAAQEFPTRAQVNAGDARPLALLGWLEAMGAAARQESEGILEVGGGDGLNGAELRATDLDASTRLALLVAGLHAQGSTTVYEAAAAKERIERHLRSLDLSVERRRREDAEAFALTVRGGQKPTARSVQLPGDLRLAYPLLIAALTRRSSAVTVTGVGMRPEHRGLLDLLRQIGGALEIETLEDDRADITARSATLKPTRVAGQRAARVRSQVPLLALLATQCQGESVIRDVEALRQGDVDIVAALFAYLRDAGARVGEFAEGLVIRGGVPLRGVTVDSHQEPALALAYGLAGLLAVGTTTVTGTECLEARFADYFATLEALKEVKR